MLALNSKTLLTTYMWRTVGKEGLERGELLQAEQHWIMSGTILRLADTGPAEVKYEIITDVQWSTRTTNVSYRDARGNKELQSRGVTTAGMQTENVFNFLVIASMLTWLGVRPPTHYQFGAST